MKTRWIKVGEVDSPSANLLIADPLDICSPGRMPSSYEELVGLATSPWIDVARWNKAKPKGMGDWLVLQVMEKASGERRPVAVVVNTGLESGFNVYAKVEKHGDWERIIEIKVVFEGDEEDETDTDVSPSQVHEALERERRARSGTR